MNLKGNEMVDLTKDEQLLKAKDVAKILNISEAQVFKLIKRKEIAAIRIGHSVRVLFADVQQFANRSRMDSFQD